MYRIRVWLRNPRNYALLGGVSASIIATVKACPQLFPNQLYRPVMEAYKGGTKVKLKEQQQDEFREVLEELHIPPEAYHPFTTSRWDIKVKGQPYLPGGVLVGIPTTFVDEPDLGSPKFTDNIKAKLDSEEGATLRGSMVLTRNARKFALAKEVVLANRCYDSYPIVIAPCAVLAGFVTTFGIQVMAGMFPLPVTGALVACAFFVTYRYLLGQLNERHDLRSDRIVSILGQSYVEGGVEFYEKCLARNRALRKLLGARGEKMYSYYGNKVSGIFWSSGAPLTVKRSKMVEMSEQFTANDHSTEKKMTD